MSTKSIDAAMPVDHVLLPGPDPLAGPAAAGGRFYLLIAPHPELDRLMDALAVRLALAAEGARQASTAQPAADPYLCILDGGNRFDLHGIARGIHAGSIHAGGLEAILRRIQVARAFTCYQMEALLAAAGPHPMPILVFRLLATFADGPFGDGAAPPAERLRLLARCIDHLKRLARLAPVMVSAAPPSDALTAGLLARLETAADQVWRFEAQARPGNRPGPSSPHAPPAPIQLSLFGRAATD
jgi:hypothetical protein